MTIECPVLHMIRSLQVQLQASRVLYATMSIDRVDSRPFARDAEILNGHLERTSEVFSVGESGDVIL